MHRYLLLLLTFIISCALGQQLYRKKLVDLHQWTDLQLNEASVNAHGLSAPPLPVDLDIEYGDNGLHRTFLTIPRLGLGLPFTLAVVAARENDVLLNPKLLPYPSLPWHIIEGNNCTGITSAIRTYIDDCWRLWVVDSGQVNSLQLCPPQILTFDLITDLFVQRFVLPPEVYIPAVSIFTALTVDLPSSAPADKCLAPMVYISDSWAYGLIVYDVMASKAWRIEHELMLPAVGVQKFRTPHAGIFTVSLSPRHIPDRQLYFHTLNSYEEVAVPLALVNNGSLWIPRHAHGGSFNHSFRVIGARGTQCESEAMDSAGNLFCSLIGLGALISWQEGTAYSGDTLRAVAYNPSQLKFVTGLKVNRNTAGEDELWALSSEPKLFVGPSRVAGAMQDIKFQIVGCRIKNLLQNEACTVGAKQPQPQPQPQHKF